MNRSFAYGFRHKGSSTSWVGVVFSTLMIVLVTNERAWGFTDGLVSGGSSAVSVDDEKKDQPKGEEAPKNEAKPLDNEGAPKAEPGAEQDPAKKAEDAKKAREAARRTQQQSRTGKPTEDKPAVPRPASPRLPTGMGEGAEHGLEMGPSQTINIQAAEPGASNVPPEEKMYGFSIKNGTAEQLLEGVARQTGLPIIGEAPKDAKVSLVTDKVMTYTEMLSRVRMLLFNAKPLEPFWLRRHETYLEVKRVNDILRELEPSQMHQSVESFRAANLPTDELSFVIFTPKSGSIADLREVRNYLPDYVRVTPLEGRNSVSIFALVRDINKYFELVPIFSGRTDPRTLKIFKLEHAMPSEAEVRIRSLMDLDRPRAGGGGPVRPGKSPDASLLDNIPEPEVSIVADDAQRRLIVRAMQDKIQEIENLLPIFDSVAEVITHEPVILEIKHADVTELVNTIQQILTFSPAPAAATPGAVTPKKKGAKAAAAAAGLNVSASPVKTDEITLLPLPSRNAIVVLADEEGVEHVRRLVAQFDVVDEIGPIKIPVHHADAAELINAIMAVKFGEAPPAGGTNLQLTPDRSGTAIWVKGNSRDIEDVKTLLTAMDVEEEVPSLHVVKLVYQRPTFVVTILRAYESGEAVVPPQVGGAAPAKGAKKAKSLARAVPDPSKFTGDDDSNRLYVLCTEVEWKHYSELIEKLEEAAIDNRAVFERVPLVHMTADAAIEKLTSVLPSTDEVSQIRFTPTDGGLLIFDATNELLNKIKTILAEVDKETPVVERTFDIQFADPGEIENAIQTLFGGDTATAGGMPRPKPRKAKPGGEDIVQPMQLSGGASNGSLTVLRFGKRLKVRTSPETMERVASLIAEFDVGSDGALVRTYGDFPPGTDISWIADTLSNIFTSSSSIPTEKGVKKKAAATASEGPQFIPQAAANQLVIIAQKDEFPKIEELLGVLRTNASQDAGPSVTTFVDLEHADPAEVVEIVDRVLAAKVKGLVSSGQLPEEVGEQPAPTTGKGRGKAPRAPSQSERYHLEADTRNGRVVIVGPQIIVDEASALIKELDKPGRTPNAPISRTVQLKNTDAAEIVKSVRELMGAPVRKASAKTAKGQPAVLPESATDTPFAITEIPGGKAVFVRGPAEEVLEAVKWIDELDAQSIPGRAIKVYDVQYTDISKLADLIMAVVDTGDKSTPGPRVATGSKKSGKGGKSETIEDDGDTDFKTVSTRVGAEVYIQTDLIKKRMIVAASQSKMAQIDPIVARFNKAPEEGEESFDTKPIPKFTYELIHKDAFDAAWDLELVLQAMWDNEDELPKVDDSPVGNFLIIKYPYPDRFDEIRELIAKHVDKPSKEDLKEVKTIMPLPEGVNPLDALEWLKSRHPEIEIQSEGAQPKPVEDFGVEEIGPPKKKAPSTHCVLPAGFVRAVQSLSVAVLLAQNQQEENGAQPDEEEEQLIEQPINPVLFNAGVDLINRGPESGKSSDDEKGGEKKKTLDLGPVKATVDPNKGVIYVEGPAASIKALEDAVKDFEDEIKKLPEKPDIRIVRVRYIDVQAAQEIIEEMFNASRQQQQQFQQMQAMNNRAMQQQQAGQRGQQQPGVQPGQQGRGEKGTEGQGRPGIEQPGGRPQQVVQQPFQMPQLPPTAVRVFANPRDRTLILRAATSQYPEIYELLATIDQPKPINSEMRVFPLEKLNAAEVESLLQDMFNLNQPENGSSRRRAAMVQPGGIGGGGGSAPTFPTLPRQIQAATMTGTLPLTVDPKDIRISSNDDANAIVAVAPKEALDYIADIIKQLESQELPERQTKHFALRFADVTEVTDYLTNQFAEARSVIRGGAGRRRVTPSGDGPAPSGGGSMNAPTFVAYSRLNMLSVQATEEQIKEVETLVATLDVLAPEDEWKTITLASADARVVADTMGAMFGGSGGSAPSSGRPSRSASQSSQGPKFIGEEGGRIVFYAAPVTMHEQIHAAVDKIEAQSKETGTVRVVELQHALPSDVADAIDAAYGGGGRRPSSGRSSRGGPSAPSSGAGGRFTVTPNDSSKRLFVVADDEMFGKIESLAQALDQPRKIGFDFKIYPLKYANARTTYQSMNKLVTDYLRMLGSRAPVEPFSVDVDDKANALVVLGGPVVFGFVEDALKTIDIAANAASPPGFFMIVLKNGDAVEVAGNITRLWAQKTPQITEQPPVVEANRALNALIVRGTQAQIEEIKKEVIDPLETQALASLKTETIKLQHAQAEQVAESVRLIFDDKKKAIQGMGTGGPKIPPAELAVAITADVTTNQVVLQASETNLALIKERIAELDKPEVAGASVTSTRTYVTKSADAATVANIITQWARSRVNPGPSGKIAPRDQVTALAEPTTQSVVVTANEANHKLISDMIAQVDTDRAVVDRAARVLTLKNADAEAVSRTLNDIFVRSAPRQGGPTGPAITIAALPGSKAILVKCKEDDFAKIKEIVTSLDSEVVKIGEVVRVVPILYADATEVHTSLKEYLRPPGATGTSGAGLSGDVRVSVLAQGNSVVISGDKDEVDRLEGMVKSLDASGEKGSVPQIIPLKHARVAQIVPSLQQMFETTSGNRRNQTPPVIVGDESQNAIVVRSSATDQAAIRAVVEQLDTEEAAAKKPFRIVSVAPGISVTQLAEQIELAVNESAKAAAGTATRSGRPVPSIAATANARTNSVLLAGSPVLFDQAEEMIRSLEKMGPSGNTATRIIKVGNITPDEVEALINQLTGEGTSGGRGRPGGTRTGGGTSRPTTPPRPRRPNQ
ncbi:MAG: secretin N-terminal domain-containing protein [Planctomycetota bacterium]